MKNCLYCQKETKNTLYCSPICALIYHNKGLPKPEPILNSCLYCTKDTLNPKFCSKSCAASFNNRAASKKRKGVKSNRKCSLENCDEIVKSYRHDMCETHWARHKDSKFHSFKEKTIGEYRKMPSVVGKHPSWLHSHIRAFARNWNKDLVKGPCAHCGYSKHVEIAHIRDIASFSDEATLLEVNGRDNLIPLCPNCHWEFDHLPRAS